MRNATACPEYVAHPAQPPSGPSAEESPASDRARAVSPAGDALRIGLQSMTERTIFIRNIQFVLTAIRSVTLERVETVMGVCV